MSQSTNGQICYGIMFPEGFVFPWELYAEEEWWLKVNGYNPPCEIYNDKGEYVDGKKPAQAKLDEYYNHRRDFKEKNPFPVELVNYCSGDCPMYILAVKESSTNNSRGFPLEFHPGSLKVTAEQTQVLLDFCNKYLKEKIDEHNDDKYNSDDQILLEPAWFLSSYWG